ncbi:MAG: hypothetical protein KDA75_01025 [Planctomycetaceae bacterium]|nr:hypothetical protein [Planctomycetaceae bacterium]
MTVDTQHKRSVNTPADSGGGLVRPLSSLVWVVCLTAGLWLSLGSAIQATEALQKRVSVVAGQVSKLLKSQSMDAISIGQFSGPPNFPTSSGPGIVQMFNDEFSKHDISVKTRAKVGLAGEYAITEIDQFDSVAGKNVKHLAVKINGRLVDQFGGVMTSFNTEGIVEGKFETTVSGAETLVETIGLPADLPANATPGEVDNKLRESLVDPKVTLSNNNTRYRASDDSPYEIEILIDDHPCAIQLEEGLPYVEIKSGQVYAVKIYNNSPHDSAVRLLIDGLSVFSFSDVRDAQTGKPKYSVYIVDAKSEATLKGWHKTNDHVESFLVTGYDNSAAAKLGHTENLGTITVTFSAAWPKGSPPPPDEFTSKSAGGNATGFGPPVEHKVEEVQRDIGRVRASLSIRYTR